MATKKAAPPVEQVDHGKVLATAIRDMCAADAIYQSCQSYPFRLFASSVINRPDVQAAVSAILEASDEGKDHSEP